MWKSIACLVLVLTIAAPARAATIYVDDSAASGGDGSLARPFASLQAAIDAAAERDDLFVAGGTYAPIAVASRELHLFGGYTDDFAMRSPDVSSVIEGTRARPTVSLYESGNSVLDGFVIRGGERGVFIDADFLSTTNRPEVRNNVIEGNGTATLNGGGVFAIHCDARFVGNTLRGNIAERGPGIATQCASVLIDGNLVEDNVAYGDHGGGLYLTGPMIVVRGNVIRRNEVGVIIGYGWGAGAVVYGAGVTATFERNVFTENHAESVGSGVFIDDGATATFEHDLFYANDCGSTGGVIYVDGDGTTVSSHLELVNVTVAGHVCAPDTAVSSAIYVQSQSTVVIRNSIFWDNDGADFWADPTSTITATYTLTDEPFSGAGNVSADPLFFDAAAGDYHVRSTRGRFDPSAGSFVLDATDSPTIDVGDPASDFAIEPGPNGMRVNLGHTGNTTQASMGGPGGVPPADGGVGADGGFRADGGVGADGGFGADASSPRDGGVAPPPASNCGCRVGAPPSRATHALTATLLFMLLWVTKRRARARPVR